MQWGSAATPLSPQVRPCTSFRKSLWGSVYSWTTDELIALEKHIAVSYHGIHPYQRFIFVPIDLKDIQFVPIRTPQKSDTHGGGQEPT